MELRNRLTDLTRKCLEEIQRHAQNNETSKVIALTRLLEEGEAQMKNLNNIMESIDKLEKAISQNVVPNGESNKSDISPAPTISSDREKIISDIKLKSFKQLGKERRNELVRLLKVQGIEFTRLRGYTYRTNKGKTVGIAYASERQPDKWFFGPPHRDYDVLILICAVNDGDDIYFYLSSEFLQRYEDDLLQKERNRYLLNLNKRGNDYLLGRPHKDGVSIVEYRNSLNVLRD